MNQFESQGNEFQYNYKTRDQTIAAGDHLVSFNNSLTTTVSQKVTLTYEPLSSNIIMTCMKTKTIFV